MDTLTQGVSVASCIQKLALVLQVILPFQKLITSMSEQGLWPHSRVAIMELVGVLEIIYKAGVHIGVTMPHANVSDFKATAENF